VERVKLELPAMNAGGEVAEVRYLLPREPDSPQYIILGGEELYGRRQTVPEERDEAGVDSARRLGRELLTDDGPHEGAIRVVGASAAASGVVEGPYPLHERVATLAQKVEARVERRGVHCPGLCRHPTGRKRALRPGSSSPGSTSARR
jgi:hypothetical protein